ncbi:GNAT family N-acetyltransferase [Promineifilum sp.]|uniref:GNAT family N-acetyltransferase n=1 Tax=Promineifilum sp. TaxID=2664178 RepID=UPI0035B00B7E
MYSLRPATPEDHDFLYALNRATIREYVEPIWGWHEEWQEEYFRKKFDPQKWQVIQVDGRDAGVLVVEQRPDEVYLGLIELWPEFQGRGVGSAVVNRLKAEAHGRGQPLTLHVLKTNVPARRLYERLGFQVVAEEEYRYRMSCP